MFHLTSLAHQEVLESEIPAMTTTLDASSTTKSLNLEISQFSSTLIKLTITSMNGNSQLPKTLELSISTSNLASTCTLMEDKMEDHQMMLMTAINRHLPLLMDTFWI